MRVIAMFAKSFKICTNSALKSFDQPFFKKVVVSKGEALVVPRRERNPPTLPKRPKGEQSLWDCGGNHKWGFPLIKRYSPSGYNQRLQIHYPERSKRHVAAPERSQRHVSKTNCANDKTNFFEKGLVILRFDAIMKKKRP